MPIDTIVMAAAGTMVFVWSILYGIKSGMLKETFEGEK